MAKPWALRRGKFIGRPELATLALAIGMLVLVVDTGLGVGVDAGIDIVMAIETATAGAEQGVLGVPVTAMTSFG